MDHSKRAIKKTVASFICLSFMLLLSFVLSTYEYNQVHTQYQRVYDDVARKLSDNDVANQTTNLLANNNTAQLKHENNASVALSQVNATHDHDSQSEEETTKRMKGSTKKNKKHHKKHKKHKHGKDHDVEKDAESTNTDEEPNQITNS